MKKQQKQEITGQQIRAALDAQFGGNVWVAYGALSAYVAGMLGPVASRKVWRADLLEMAGRGAEILAEVERGKK